LSRQIRSGTAQRCQSEPKGQRRRKERGQQPRRASQSHQWLPICIEIGSLLRRSGEVQRHAPLIRGSNGWDPWRGCFPLMVRAPLVGPFNASIDPIHGFAVWLLSSGFKRDVNASTCMTLNKELYLRSNYLTNAMTSFLLLLAVAGPTMAVKGTSIYYHTGESGSKLLAKGCAEHDSEGDCREGHRANAIYHDYSVQAGIDRNKCWPREVESNTKDGARRRSVWVAPPPYPSFSYGSYCLWSYPADDAANDFTSDGVVTMTIHQNRKTQ